MHHADVLLEADDARVLAAALGPEPGPVGTDLAFEVQGRALRLHFDAQDLSGLRAALQGALRLTDAAARAIAPPGDDNR